MFYTDFVRFRIVDYFDANARNLGYEIIMTMFETQNYWSNASHAAKGPFSLIDLMGKSRVLQNVVVPRGLTLSPGAALEENIGG